MVELHAYLANETLHERVGSWPLGNVRPRNLSIPTVAWVVIMMAVADYCLYALPFNGCVQ
jgi:hypothetical protein